MLVANSFPRAPNKNATVGVILFFFSNMFFSCSKIVYWRIGLMTNTKAGTTPANKACGPSSLIKASNVPTVVGALGALAPGNRLSSVSLFLFLVVIRVLTTQIGFVSRTVADPAIAPAIIDSIVVSLFEARPAFTAAFSNPARVHSYQ